MDLLLDRRPGVHDLVFVNGACPTTGDRVDVVIQRLYIRLRTFYQEWFINIEYGTPWFEKVLGHKVKSKSTIDMVIQEQILAESGVSGITFFTSSLDTPTRQYTCTFRVKTDAGESANITI